ncbi:PREDICTED: kynurenine--oxoglutarate transaminase 1-like [Populus euphratica]|uniref:Kynurenine--oxoglutarate transaminase 1-like n=1 Tax=Populus euphratica TaxID=75702 RepID=A0AAJ6WZ51_POPEU|nr:PREDICTED: kynurenine--oxoglutarate transaminase 1-like [Populus euphratica]
MAGAKIKGITFCPPAYSVPIDELKSAITKNTRAILISTPHNLTGKMFIRVELGTIASLCIENDVLVFTDEVYDKLAFETDHISMAPLPEMYERTWAAAFALRAPESYYVELKRDYMAKKEILVEGLKAVGFKVFPSSGTYFVVVDHTPFGLENDIAFCEYLIKEVGVVAIPTSVFYLNPEDGKNLVRFTFCKDEETLKAAVERKKEKLKRK